MHGTGSRLCVHFPKVHLFLGQMPTLTQSLRGEKVFGFMNTYMDVGNYCQGSENELIL